MREIAIGERTYRVQAVDRDGRWIARAVEVESGDPFGIECAGDSEAAAVERLAIWLDWQHEHAAALHALQQAERDFYRTVAGSAFANPIEGPTAIEMQKESLDLVEAARVRLDELRARKPE